SVRRAASSCADAGGTHRWRRGFSCSSWDSVLIEGGIDGGAEDEGDGKERGRVPGLREGSDAARGLPPRRRDHDEGDRRAAEDVGLRDRRFRRLPIPLRERQRGRLVPRRLL